MRYKVGSPLLPTLYCIIRYLLCLLSSLHHCFVLEVSFEATERTSQGSPQWCVVRVAGLSVLNCPRDARAMDAHTGPPSLSLFFGPRYPQNGLLRTQGHILRKNLAQFIATEPSVQEQKG